MNAPAHTRARLETAIALARLFEHVERYPMRVSAEQYQALVRQLKVALDDNLPAEALNAVLQAHPAAAELYENLHYDRSGLSRSPLDQAVTTEMQAAQLLSSFTLAGRGKGDRSSKADHTDDKTAQRDDKGAAA